MKLTFFILFLILGLLKPPRGVPREHHQGEVWQKSSSYTKFHRTQQMTGRVDIVWRIFFYKIAEKLKMKSQDRKNVGLMNLSENVKKEYFFGFCDLNLIFFFNFFKNAPDYIYRPFRSFCLLWHFFCLNYYRLFFQLSKSYISSLFINQSSEFFPFIFIYKFCNKSKSNQTTMRTSRTTYMWSSTRNEI